MNSTLLNWLLETSSPNSLVSVNQNEYDLSERTTFNQYDDVSSSGGQTIESSSSTQLIYSKDTTQGEADLHEITTNEFDYNVAGDVSTLPVEIIESDSTISELDDKNGFTLAQDQTKSGDFLNQDTTNSFEEITQVITSKIIS